MITDQFKLFVLDRAKGTKIRWYYNLYRHSLCWGRKEIDEFQKYKLKQLLDHAYRNVPFYQERFERCNLTPDSITSIDLLNKIPPLTRNDVVQNMMQMTDKNNEYKRIEKSSSSGTTGMPISYLIDLNGKSAGIAAGYMCRYLSNWNLGNKNLHIWGNPVSIKRWNSWGSRLKRILLNQKNMDSTLLNDEKYYPEIIKFINTYKPEAIDGYTSAIHSLASYVLTRNLPIHKSKFVFTTAENLLPHQSSIIEEVLGPVSDIYGCGEINGIAAKAINNDRYYIIEPHVIVETATSTTGDDNEVIVTDLDNRIMPFIRYKIGDLIDGLYIDSDHSRLNFKYFKKIIGRKSEIIELPNGKKIHPINLLGGTIFRIQGGVVRHKVIWNGQSLNFIFEVNEQFDYKKMYTNIEKELSKYNIDFKIEIVDRLLPDATGKYKYYEIIS